jgi:hypothetical protein
MVGSCEFSEIASMVCAEEVLKDSSVFEKMLLNCFQMFDILLEGSRIV